MIALSLGLTLILTTVHADAWFEKPRRWCEGLFIRAATTRAREAALGKAVAVMAAGPFFPEGLTPFERSTYLRDRDNLRVIDRVAHLVQFHLDERTNDHSSAPIHYARIVIATHVRPPQQAAVAEFLDQPRFAEMPRILLVDAHAAFSLKDPRYAATRTHVFYSRGGELHRRVTADEIYLIGGYESDCLGRTLDELTRDAADVGRRTLNIVLPTEYTYAYREKKSLHDVREGRVDAATSTRVVAEFLSGWHVDTFARHARGVVITATHERHPLGLRLRLE